MRDKAHLLYAVQNRLYKDGALGSFAITTFYCPKRSPQSNLLIFSLHFFMGYLQDCFSIFKKPKTTANLYIQEVRIHLYQSSELRVCSTSMCTTGNGKPLCLSFGYVVVWAMWVCWVLGLRVSARTKTLTQISDYSEYLNTEVKGPRAQIILSILTLRSKTKVGTTSCDTHGLPQPCIKTSCMEAFNVTA